MEAKTNWLAWRVWWVGALVWFAHAAFMFLVILLQPPIEGMPHMRVVSVNLGLRACPYVVLTPVLLHLGQQCARQRWSRPQLLWRLAALVVLAAAVNGLAMVVLSNTPADMFLSQVLGQWLTELFPMAAIVAIAVVVDQRQAVEARQHELLATQLRALRAQLQPHFLFNTLHAIGVTTRTDPTVAVRMLTLLGDLLRQTLRERDGQLVSLAEERDLLQPYLELQQLRFADRLRFEVDLPAEVLGAAVPDLLLQPLVENALQHGIEQRPQGGTVRIAARRWGERLEIQVRDDGVGLAPQPAEGSLGIGLGTTRARLQALFGAAAEVKLAADPAGGTMATLLLPFRELAPGAEIHAA